MQSQLAWGQKKFIKFEMKKGGSKKETSNNWSRVFQIALKVGERGWEFCLDEYWPFKISMTYLYIKPKVKKNHTTAMTINEAITAINETCIWWLHGNCYLVRGVFLMITWKLLFGEGSFSGVWNEHFLYLLSRVLPPSTGFLPNGRFRGRGRAVYTWWGQQARWK